MRFPTVLERFGFPATIPKFKRSWADALRISLAALINSPLAFREMRVSDRENRHKFCGDTVTFEKQ